MYESKHSVPPKAPVAPDVPLSKRPLFTPRVVAWVTAGALAIGYLAVLAAAPELLDDLTPNSVQYSEPASNRGQRAAARLAEDVRALRDSVANVQLELSKVKTEVAGHGEREKILTSQLIALEKKLVATEAAASIATGGSRTTPAQPQAEAQTAQPIETVTPPQPAKPPAAPQREASGTHVQPKMINADAAAPGLAIENGGVQTTGEIVTPAPAPAAPAVAAATPAKPIAFGPAVVKPAGKPLGVQISSGASVDSLRLSWSLLADRHAEALKNLQPRYVAGGTAETPAYDLIAGPLKSKADAARVCKALAAKNIPCKVGDFAGEAL